MCNAAKKLTLAALAIACLASCSKDPDKEAANELVQRIESAMDAGDFTQALALIDSVNILYPAQVEARKTVTALKPKAIEAVTMRQIETADSIIAFSQVEIEQLQPLFKHISGDELEGYFVVKDAYNPNFINSTGFEARINDHDNRFYIVAQVQGKRPGISQVALYSGADKMASEILPKSSARRVDIEGSELASFLPEEVFDLGEWASQHAVDGGEIIFGSGSQKIKFTPAQAAAFGTAFRYSLLKLRNANAQNLRIKLERQLDVARQQTANTFE